MYELGSMKSKVNGPFFWIFKHLIRYMGVKGKQKHVKRAFDATQEDFYNLPLILRLNQYKDGFFSQILTN